MRHDAEVAIIGSGVTGLSTAYSLTEKGLADIVVLDKGYLSSGASSRNGGGIRAQFVTKENIMLARWSIERFRVLGPELGANFWFRRGGYLFLAESEGELDTLRRAVEFQRSHGLGTREVDCDEVQELVPNMSCSGIHGGAFRKGDGVLFPFPLLFGYAEALRSRGVEISTRREVTGIRRSANGFELSTTAGPLLATKVLNATGGWSPTVSGMLGVQIPTSPVRHQIMASEPLLPVLDPMVVTIKDGFYMSQGPRGELVGGITERGTHGNDPSRSGIGFCQQISRRIVSLFPSLSAARMMRQWAGFYDMSPDANPILDELPGAEGAFVACGFSGHGFMISPAVGDFMASLIMGEKPRFDRDAYRLSRFAEGRMARETLVVG